MFKKVCPLGAKIANFGLRRCNAWKGKDFENDTVKENSNFVDEDNGF